MNETPSRTVEAARWLAFTVFLGGMTYYFFDVAMVSAAFLCLLGLFTAYITYQRIIEKPGAREKRWAEYRKHQEKVRREAKAASESFSITAPSVRPKGPHTCERCTSEFMDGGRVGTLYAAEHTGSHSHGSFWSRFFPQCNSPHISTETRTAVSSDSAASVHQGMLPRFFLLPR